MDIIEFSSSLVAKFSFFVLSASPDSSFKLSISSKRKPYFIGLSLAAAKPTSSEVVTGMSHLESLRLRLEIRRLHIILAYETKNSIV